MLYVHVIDLDLSMHYTSVQGEHLMGILIGVCLIMYGHMVVHQIQCHYSLYSPFFKKSYVSKSDAFHFESVILK